MPCEERHPTSAEPCAGQAVWVRSVLMACLFPTFLPGWECCASACALLMLLLCGSAALDRTGADAALTAAARTLRC